MLNVYIIFIIGEDCSNSNAKMTCFITVTNDRTLAAAFVNCNNSI